MTQFQRLTHAAIATVSLFAIAAPVMAIPTSFKDTAGNIYVMGQTPSAPVEMTYLGQLTSRNLTANGCGLAIMRPSSSNPTPPSFTYNGSTITVGSLPTQLLPGCTNGVLQEARSANFKTSSGEVVLVGAAANAQVQISVPRDRVRRSTSNACGFVRFATSQSYQHGTGTNVTLSGVFSNTAFSSIQTEEAPLCRTVNGVGRLYVPAAWLPGS
jgi:hypothetical protein